MRVSRVIKNIIRLILAVILGLALVGSLPIPAQAQDPVDLVLGGEGATSWDIANIMPGDSGNKTVTLHNAGYNDGFVTIWVSDIVNSEGTNPESETGDTAEPGELSEYLMFNLSGTGLSANLSLPATIDSFPQTAAAPNYIKVSPLNAGDTVDLVWQWELPTQTGNDVQGDNLSFTINYTLQEFPSNTGSSGGGGTGITRSVKIDMLGEISWVEIKPDGTFYRSYVLTSFDNCCTMEIDSSTKLIRAGNKWPTKIVVTLASESLPAPDGMAIASQLYEFTAYARGGTCSTVEFDPPIKVILSYHPEMLPDNTSAVFVAYYNGQSWIEMRPPTDSVAESGKAKAEVSHFSLFAVMARLVASPLSPSQPSVAPPQTPTPPSSPPPVASAEFQVSDLAIYPDPALPNQPVLISVSVSNTGSTSGSIRLELRIGELFAAARELILPAGGSETVTFEVPQLPVGMHQVQIGGLIDQLTVANLPPSPVNPPTPTKSATNWTLIGLTVGIGVTALAGLLVWRLRRHRRSRTAQTG